MTTSSKLSRQGSSRPFHAFRSQDINSGFEQGLRWTQKADGDYQLKRSNAGRVVVTNYDPLTLTDLEQLALNERIKRNPKSFVYLHLRADSLGGDWPIEGALKLRSLLQVIDFVAARIHVAPEFEVSKDPRTGQVRPGQTHTLRIEVSDSEPSSSVPSVNYRGHYHSVADTSWDRQSFVALSYLFQTAVGDVTNLGIPITISK